jgi:hypothetical protein
MEPGGWRDGSLRATRRELEAHQGRFSSRSAIRSASEIGLAAVRPPQQVGLQEPAQNLLLLTRRLGIEGGKAPGEPVGSGVAWPMKHLVSPLRDGESARMSHPLDKVCAAVLLSLAVPATAYAQPCRTQSFSGAQGGPLLLDSVPKARHGTWI